jgi:hypothetical protein
MTLGRHGQVIFALFGVGTLGGLSPARSSITRARLPG